MIRMSMKLPEKIAIAVSGGADSMAVLDFLSKGKDVAALHFNHGTEHADEAEKLVTSYCQKNDIPLLVGRLKEVSPKGVSKEEFWRDQRYSFFDQVSKTPFYSHRPIITCHHLDDLVETWLFTSFHGESKLIPSQRGRYLRPFLITRKVVLEEWCDRKSVSYVTDPSNMDNSYMRNYIRHEIVPRTLRVNPGLPKVLRKKVLNNPLIFD
jgi:tRNA(Ile)-lysidine synthase|tara:strand:- start:1482 stop:2108 length:627 start_codon:yes stop_codon:yes gene_type:complete